MLNPDEFHLTQHFVGRALDMLLSPDQIEDVLLNPDCRSTSIKYGTTNYRKGDVTFAVNDAVIPHEVITAVWSSEDAWQKDFDRAAYLDRQRCAGFGSNRQPLLKDQHV